MPSAMENAVLEIPVTAEAVPERPGLRQKTVALASTGAGRSTIAMFDQILVSAANFLMLVAIARLSATSQTGTYVLALRTVDFITEIQNVFLWAPYTLFAPGFTSERRRSYAGSVLAHQFAAALLTLLALGAFAVCASYAGWQEASVVACWSMLAAAGIHLREFVRRISFANLDLLSALLMDAAIFAGQAAGFAALYGSRMLTGRNALIVTGTVSGVAAAAYLLGTRRRFIISKADVLPDLKRNLAYGRWLLGSDLALLLGNQIYPWFLALLSGSGSVALFAASQALTNFARMFLIGAQNVLLPSSARAFASGSRSALQQLVSRGTLMLGGGAALFCAGAFLVSGQILKLVYGQAFSGHGSLVFVLSLSILATALTLAPTFALAAAMRADANLRINAVTLALHVTAGLFLVWSYGPIGAAYGLALGGFTAAFLRWRIYRRLLVLDGTGKVEQ